MANHITCGICVTPLTGGTCRCLCHKKLDEFQLRPGLIIPLENNIQGSTRNPWLNQVLSKIAQLHDKKNHDYCPDDNNPFFNFEVSAKYADLHVKDKPAHINFGLLPVDSFNILLGIKLARLYALLERGTQPNNEAFIDSEWDYVVYFLLRESYKLKLAETK